MKLMDIAETLFVVWNERIRSGGYGYGTQR